MVGCVRVRVSFCRGTERSTAGASAIIRRLYLEWPRLFRGSERCSIPALLSSTLLPPSHLPVPLHILQSASPPPLRKTTGHLHVVIIFAKISDAQRLWPTFGFCFRWGYAVLKLGRGHSVRTVTSFALLLRFLVMIRVA